MKEMILSVKVAWIRIHRQVVRFTGFSKGQSSCIKGGPTRLPFAYYYLLASYLMSLKELSDKYRVSG